MSLLDALLLDPAPFQIWIADRNDRQKGSGTASDPFDGGLSAAKFDAIMSQIVLVLCVAPARVVRPAVTQHGGVKPLPAVR